MSFWLSDLEGLGLQAVLFGLVGYTAFRVGCALLPDSADLLERIGFVGLVGVMGWLALLQVLGLLGVLWLPVVIACLAVSAGVSRLLLSPPRKLRWSGSHAPLGVVAVAVPVAALAVVETLWSPPSFTFSFDTLHYHIVNAVQYLDSGSIRSLPFAQPGDNTGAAPGNGSLLLLAVMLPFHTAALVDLPNLLCAGLLVAVTALLMRELGRGAWTGVAAGLVVVTTVCFFQTQMQSAYDDSLALLGLMSAMAFGLRSARTGERAPLLLAGASLAIAIGTKDAYILPGAVVAAVLLWANRASWSPGWMLAFLAAMLSLSLCWYVRDWAVTGDPLFPQTVRIGPTVLFAGLDGTAAAFSNVDPSLAGVFLGGAGATVTQWLEYVLMNFGMGLAAVAISPVLALWSRGRARLVATVAVGCSIAYGITPFTGSAAPSQLNAGTRFLLPAVAFGVVALSAALTGRWFRVWRAVALGVDAALLIDVGAVTGFISPALLVDAAIVAGCVLAALYWWRPLRGFAGHRAVRGGAAVALLAVTILVTARLQPSAGPTLVETALDAARDPGSPVVVMDVGDVTALLGPRLDVNIVAAGQGPVGAERPIRSAAQLTSRIEALHPAAVVVGHEGLFDVVPAGWAPPPTWRPLGTEDGSVVYEP